MSQTSQQQNVLGTEINDSPELDKYEVNIRGIFYFIYFAIFLSISSACYEVISSEIVTILFGFVLLLIFRILCKRKFKKIRQEDIPSKFQKLYNLINFFLTMVLLIAVSGFNLQQNRFDASFIGTKCALWNPGNGNQSQNENNTLINSDEPKPNLIEDSKSYQISNGTSDANATKVCIMTCDTVYFYPTALLLFDLICLLGFFKLLILTPFYNLYKLCCRDPVAPYCKIIHTSLYALVTLLAISFLLFTLFTFKFEYDPILCGFCVVILLFLLIQSIFCVLTFFKENENVTLSLTWLTFINLLLSGAMFAAFETIKIYVKLSTYSNYGNADVPFDLGVVPDEWMYFGGGILWNAIGAFLFAYALLSYSFNKRNLINEYVTTKRIVVSFFVPFVPLLLVLVMLLVLFAFICCFCCRMIVTAGGNRWHRNERYVAPNGTVTNYIPEGYQVSISSFW